MPGAREGLTASQRSVLDRLLQFWDNLSEPTVVVLETPGGWGKTRVIQSFYDEIASAQPTGWSHWLPGMASPTVEGWRKARKSVTPSSCDPSQRIGWMWHGLEAYPNGSVDLLAGVRRRHGVLVEVLKRMESDKSVLSRGAARGVPRILAKSSLDLLADLIPGGGFAKVGLEAAIGVAQAFRARDQLGIPLSPHDPEEVSRAVLLESFATSALSGGGGALAPIVIAVDDAQMTDQLGIADLDAVIRANPEAQLLAAGLLKGVQQQAAASLGLPPVAPILILATRQPFGPEALDYFGHQIDVWRQRGIAVHTFSSNDMLPCTIDEGARIALTRVPSLNEVQARVLADHANDRLHDRVNLSLLMAHCERVSLLSEPSSTVSHSWAMDNLPRFLEDEARLRFDALNSDSQRVVIAGSLRGPGFAAMFVERVLERQPVESWLPHIADTGFVMRRDESPDFPYLVFGDEGAYSFARSQVITDAALCSRSLREVSAPIISRMLTGAHWGTDGLGAMSYSMARDESDRFLRLADEAKVAASEVDGETWAAVLGFASEVRYALEKGSEEPSPAFGMRWLWRSMLDSREALRGDGWTIGARWVVHKYVPGQMTFQSALAMFDAGEFSRPTRLELEAPRYAVRVAMRVLVDQLAHSTIGEPCLRLLFRLGPTGRQLPGDIRRQVALHLLRLSPQRLSAAALLAGVYSRDLRGEEAATLAAALLAGGQREPGNLDVRRDQALAWLDLPLGGLAEARLVDGMVDAFGADREEFDSTFGVAGRILDTADPMVFPWSHRGLRAAIALLSMRQIAVPASARTAALAHLEEAAELHPGATWYLRNLRKTEASASLMSMHAKWSRVGAIDAGRVDLFGNSGTPPKVKRAARSIRTNHQ